MAYFHLKLTPPRQSFPHDATAEEMAAMQRHAAYWRQNAETGMAIAVGPVFEQQGAWGMAIIEVADVEAARAAGNADPVVLADLGFRYEVSPIPSLILRQSVAGASSNT
ncbi:YciI family protein [Rhizobium sp. 2YAF20]|uniref:YciI family protein n=1 Tax=Rhizobium sp. 2YAF20 TaxID=3233027 RepID=UPI003F9627F9